MTKKKKTNFHAEILQCDKKHYKTLIESEEKKKKEL